MSEKGFDIIAKIKTPYKSKFGVPRQSGMIEDIVSEIIFEPQYRNIDSVRGLSEFSHIWVIWKFEGFERDKWSPTVRPPRLGGNKRVGVFATRSPNRPNPIAMSCLKLLEINIDSNCAPILRVSGADMVDGTAIYDIKPYIPFTDCHTNATSGFTKEYQNYKLDVIFPREKAPMFSDTEWKNAISVISLDPRPAYQNDEERIYGVSLYDINIKFKVEENTAYVLSVDDNSFS